MMIGFCINMYHIQDKLRRLYNLIAFLVVSFVATEKAEFFSVRKYWPLAPIFLYVPPYAHLLYDT